MKHTTGQVQRAEHRLSIVSMQCIQMLRMSNDEVNALVAATAEENPFLEPTDSSGRGWQASGASEVSGYESASETSLYSHLAQQIAVLISDPLDRLIAHAFLAELDGCGWLGVDVADVADMTGVPICRATFVLRRLQHCEPVGVFARNLRECLTLQAQDRGLLTAEMEHVLANLPMLGEHLTTSALAGRLGMTEAAFRATLKDLRRLDPKPGAKFDIDHTLAREPDAIVLMSGEWPKVRLNAKTCPSVSISRFGRIGSSADGEFDKLRHRARQFRSAIQQRNQTTLLVLEALVSGQTPYFRGSATAVQPLTQADIAEASGVHLSTVSRVLTGLLLDTPRGVLMAKDLISRPVHGGGSVSEQALRQAILALIKSEDRRFPLTDAKLQACLVQQGIHVSRSTIAKYRLDMRIAASHERRRRERIPEPAPCG